MKNNEKLKDLQKILENHNTTYNTDGTFVIYDKEDNTFYFVDANNKNRRDKVFFPFVDSRELSPRMNDLRHIIMRKIQEQCRDKFILEGKLRYRFRNPTKELIKEVEKAKGIKFKPCPKEDEISLEGSSRYTFENLMLDVERTAKEEYGIMDEISEELRNRPKEIYTFDDLTDINGEINEDIKF